MGSAKQFYGNYIDEQSIGSARQFYGDALVTPRPPAGEGLPGIGDQAPTPTLPGSPLLTPMHYDEFRQLSEPEAFSTLSEIEENDFYGMSMQEYQKLVRIYFDEISPETSVAKEKEWASPTGRFRDMGFLQKMLAVAGPLPIKDLIEGKPIGTSAGYLLEALDYMDRPRRVITNATYQILTDPRSRIPSPGIVPQFINSIMTGKESLPMFESLEDAIRSGWSGDKSVSTRKLIQTYGVGRDQSENIDRLLDSHTATRWAKKIGDIGGDLITDFAIDWTVINGIIKPIRSGTIMAGATIGTTKTKQFFAKLGGVPGSPIGFHDNVIAGINRVARENGLLYKGQALTADGLMRDSLRRMGTEVTPIYKVSLAEQAAKRAGINRAVVDIVDAKRAYRRAIENRSAATVDVGEQLDNIKKFAGEFTEPSSLRTVDDWLLRQDYNYWRAKNREKLLIRQTRRKLGEVAEAEEIHRTLVRNLKEGDQLGAIDYMATSRLLREEFVKSTLKRRGLELKRPLEYYVNAVTPADVRGDIALLSDEAFDTIFDFVEWSSKNPKFYDMIKKDLSGAEFLVKRPMLNQFVTNTKQFARRLYINHTIAPSWQVFHRSQADELYQVVDAARVSQYQHIEAKMFNWKYLMSRAGKDAVTQERIFLLSWGKLDEYEGLARGISKAQRAVERQAADYFRGVAKEFADMAIVQGRLSLTGKAGKPRVIKDYVPFMYEQATIDAMRMQNQYRVLAKELAEKAGDEALTALQKQSLLDEAADALRNADEAKYTLDDLADMFEFRTKTRVDIPEFKRRFTTGEGIIKDADLAFTRMLNHETKALWMQPAFEQSKAMVKLTENSDLIRYTRDWINAQQGLPTKLEGRLEPFAMNITKSVEAVGSMFPDFMHVQWVAKDRAVRQISRWFRNQTYFAAMGFNPGPTITNATQSLLTNTAIGTEATFAGFRSLTTEGGQAMLKHSRVLVGRNPMTTLSLNALSKVNKVGGWSFRMVDRWMNVSPAYNGSMYKLIKSSPDNMKILAKYGSTQGNGFWSSLSRAMNAGEFAPEMLMADRIVKITQYSYLPHDLPKYLWGPIGKTFGQFTSWPANYWTSFIPEMTKWMWTGQGPWGKLGPIERATLLRHVLAAETLIYFGKQVGLDFTKHRPVQTTAPFLGGPTPQGTPALNIAQGLVKWASAKGDARKSGEGKYLMMTGAMFKPIVPSIGGVIPIGIPFYPQALRRVERMMDDGDPKEMFFRVNPEESYKSQSGGLGGLSGF